MTRHLALAAGLMLGLLSSGSLLAQTSATAKPGHDSTSMRHSTPPVQAKPTQHVATGSVTNTVGRHAAWTKTQIEEAQEGLAKAGFYKGQATGVFNKKTRKAIREYQKVNKLPVTGRLNEDLLKRLQPA